MEKDYMTLDQVLPIISLEDPCPIRVRITDKFVYLYVGQRDWQWDRETGKMVGAGTCLG